LHYDNLDEFSLAAGRKNQIKIAISFVEGPKSLTLGQKAIKAKKSQQKFCSMNV
jgi:hypothetical protein